MLITKEVEVSWHYGSRKHYEDLGYVYTKCRDKFTVPIEHLYPNNSVRIKIECDYCGEEFTRCFSDHTRIINRQSINKDACKDCGILKTKETLKLLHGVESPFELKETRDKAKNTFMERYGVDNPFEIPEVIEKIKETNLDKYGYEYYTQTEEYKIRSKATCMEKYGVDNASKSEEVIEKIKQVQFEKYGGYYSATDEFKEKYKETCLDRYGVENTFQMLETLDKIRNINLSRYGVTHPMKVEKIKIDRVRKMVKTKYRNGSGQSSRQQDYLHKLIGGEINYPFDVTILDIALRDENIFIEYDGSGHRLSVQFGDISQEDFEIKEQKRKYYLLSKGWKEIRIISLKDYLPQDEVVLDMIEYAKQYINTGHSWIKFDIDNGIVECSQYKKDYDFGNLRKITENVLEEIS